MERSNKPPSIVTYGEYKIIFEDIFISNGSSFFEAVYFVEDHSKDEDCNEHFVCQTNVTFDINSVISIETFISESDLRHGDINLFSAFVSENLSFERIKRDGGLTVE